MDDQNFKLGSVNDTFAEIKNRFDKNNELWEIIDENIRIRKQQQEIQKYIDMGIEYGSKILMRGTCACIPRGAGSVPVPVPQNTIQQLENAYEARQ